MLKSGKWRPVSIVWPKAVPAKAAVNLSMAAEGIILDVVLVVVVLVHAPILWRKKEQEGLQELIDAIRI